jgi:urease accessory protein UreH
MAGLVSLTDCVIDGRVGMDNVWEQKNARKRRRIPMSHGLIVEENLHAKRVDSICMLIKKICMLSDSYGVGACIDDDTQ